MGYAWKSEWTEADFISNSLKKEMCKLCLCWLSNHRDELFRKSLFVISLHVFLQDYRSRTSPCTARVGIANKIYSLSMPSFIIHWEGSLLSGGESWIVVDAADTNKKLGKNTVEYCHNIIMFLKQKKNASFPILFGKQRAQFAGNYLYSRRWQTNYSRSSQSPLKKSSWAGGNKTGMSLPSISS